MKLYELHLNLEWNPKSLNKTLNSHWRDRHRANKSWDLFIAAHVADSRPPKPLERAKLSITRHAHRMLDFDGLVGSFKPVVDALVTAGIFQDDSWKVLGAWVPDQKFRPKKDGPMLEIHIQGFAPNE